MNVKKKLAWMKLYETYWNVLPPEMEDYIIEFKIRQEYLDEVRAELIWNLRLEITLYGQLKLKWGLGHIKCIAPRWKCRWLVIPLKLWLTMSTKRMSNKACF